jgi:uncharacterized protein with HEPN domain
MYNYIPQKPIDGSENIYARAKKIDWRRLVMTRQNLLIRGYDIVEMKRKNIIRQY